MEKLKLRKLRKRLKEFESHLKDILHVNDDILLPSVKDKAKIILDDAGKASRDNAAEIGNFLDKAPMRAAKILPSRRFPTLREYADVLVVAFSVAFGIRALYLQPFKIPTSSMQPTLFGIHFQKKDSIPDLPQPLSYLLFSTRKAEMKVSKAGYLDINSFYTTKSFLLFDNVHFKIAGADYKMPGDIKHIEQYCLKRRLEFEEGESLCDGWLSLGDHLFVDRWTYHFKEPARGDIVVFVTDGLKTTSGPYYIKRLIGMPGDTLKIVDRTIFVQEKQSGKFVPITDFKNKNINKIYEMKGAYHGHLPAGLLSDEKEFHVPENHYFMMGDNSSNSSDSRDWGPVPRQNIVGKAFFIFWPFSRRWGIPDGAKPLDFNTFSVESPMEYQ